jgi:hypothetical protein
VAVPAAQHMPAHQGQRLGPGQQERTRFIEIAKGMAAASGPTWRTRRTPHSVAFPQETPATVPVNTSQVGCPRGSPAGTTKGGPDGQRRSALLRVREHVGR